jgi:hypothetical protein
MTITKQAAQAMCKVGTNLTDAQLREVIATIGKDVMSDVVAATILRQGGGWFAADLGGWRTCSVYVCTGCHKDGTSGWKVTEVR